MSETLTQEDFLKEPTAEELPTEVLVDEEPEIPPVQTHEICNVAGCTNPVRERKPGARGRAPTKCELHSTVKTPKSRTPGSEQMNLLSEEERKKSQDKIEKTVRAWLSMLQLAMLARQDVYCARAIGDHGPAIGESLATIAQEFPLLKKTLEAGDKWTAILVLSWNLIQLGLKMGVHHNVVPYEGAIKFLVPNPPPRKQVNLDGSSEPLSSFVG